VARRLLSNVHSAPDLHVLFGGWCNGSVSEVLTLLNKQRLCNV
jgi:hypothetical protein